MRLEECSNLKYVLQKPKVQKFCVKQTKSFFRVSYSVNSVPIKPSLYYGVQSKVYNSLKKKHMLPFLSIRDFESCRAYCDTCCIKLNILKVVITIAVYLLGYYFSHKIVTYLNNVLVPLTLSLKIDTN